MEIWIIIFTIYLFISGYTTIFLGRTLYINGEHFLMSIFRNKTETVFSINKILLTGYYLVNLGFVLLFFTQKQEISNFITGLEFLCKKIGTLLLVLGCMHFFNISVFVAIERKLFNSKQ